MTKLYVYVDESGIGALPFTVAVVIVADGREAMVSACERIEHETKKGAMKWGKTNYERRLSYMRAILADGLFEGTLYFSAFDQLETYDMATISSIARAIEHVDPNGVQKVSVFIDGLNDKKKQEYSTQIRRRVASFVDVRGVARDESSPLIRLADALAGFVSDARDEHSKEIVMLFERARRKGVLISV